MNLFIMGIFRVDGFKFVLDPHAIIRLEERGITIKEIKQTISSRNNCVRLRKNFGKYSIYVAVTETPNREGAFKVVTIIKE